MKKLLLVLLWVLSYSFAYAQCNVQIPAQAEAIKHSGLYSEVKAYWLCPDTWMQYTGKKSVFFVEPKARLMLAGDSNVIFIQDDASLFIKGKHNIIYVEGKKGISSDTINTYSACPDLVFVYDSTRQDGCPAPSQGRTVYVLDSGFTLINDTLVIDRKKEEEKLQQSADNEEDTVVFDVLEPNFEDIEEEDLYVGEKIRLDHVLFDKGKYVLKSEAYPELDKLIELMKKHPSMKIELEGHTDITGSDRQNMLLSKHRVSVVRHYLVQKGIAEKRIKTKAWGSSKPLTENRSEAGRRLNRRVEMKILSL